MRKTLLFYLLIFISTFASSQNPINVDTIIVVQNTNKAEMFVKASTWIAQKYNSAQDVVQFSDKETGVIVCKGTFHHEFGSRGLYSQFYGYIDYTMSIKFKDDKIRITLENFTHRSDDPTNPFFANSFGVVTDNPESGGKWKKRKSFHKYWTDLGSRCIQYSYNIIAEIHNTVSQANSNDW